jgi:2'-5' RNA ligase
VTLATTLRFDDDLSGRVAALWVTLAETGLADDRIRLDYAPHITMGLYGDDVEIDTVARAVSAVGRGVRSFTVVLSHVGVFPGPRPVVFLAPVVCEPLLAIHRDMQAALSSAEPHAHYAAGNWAPHVTIADAPRSPASVVDAASALTFPLRGRVVGIDGVRFPPVAVEFSAALVD